MGFPWWTLHKWKRVRRDCIIKPSHTAGSNVHSSQNTHNSCQEPRGRGLSHSPSWVPLADRHQASGHPSSTQECFVYTFYFLLAGGSKVPFGLESFPCLLNFLYLRGPDQVCFFYCCPMGEGWLIRNYSGVGGGLVSQSDLPHWSRLF